MKENLLRISFTFILLMIWLSYTQSVIVHENEKDSIISETAVSLLQEEPIYLVENTQEEPKQEETQQEIVKEEVKQEEIQKIEEPKQEEIKQQEEQKQETVKEEVKQEEIQKIEEPKQEEMRQEPIKEEVKQEEPKQEEIKQEEPKQEESQENKQEEIKQEEPKQEESQENKQEEIKQEEPKQETVKEEVKQEEIKQEEPKQEEPKQEPIKEEIKQEEPKQETVKEEVKQEEIKQEEPKQEEIKQEEPKQEEIKQEEPKQEENAKSEIYISQDILREAIQAMAVQKNYIAVAGESGSVVLIDRKSKQKIDWIEETKSESIKHLYFTQDEKYLFSVDHKGYIIKWNLDNKRDEGWYKSNSNIESMSFSNDGSLCSIHTAKYTRIYDFSTDKAKNISTLSKLGQSIAITSDSILSLCNATSKRMASFYVYGMKNNKWDRKPLFETSDFIGNMISYDSDCIAWNQNQIFNLNATESLQNKSWQWNLWQTCPKNIDSIVYNEDGSIIGVIDIDSMITFYERTTSKQLATFNIPNEMLKGSIHIVNAFQLILLSNNGNIYKVDISF